jgi:hypothetical protein
VTFATSDHDRQVGLLPFEAPDQDQEPEALGDGAGAGHHQIRRSVTSEALTLDGMLALREKRPDAITAQGLA